MMSLHRLVLMPSGRQGEVAHDSTVLDAARRLGVEIESICGGRQTCGKCLVELQRGEFPKHAIRSLDEHLTAPDQTERQYAHEHAIDLDQRRLSCSARILGDVLIAVPEESQARKQVIRKEGTALSIEVLPAVRLVYVEVEEAQLGSAGDWQRVQTALVEQWDLEHVELDPILLPGLQAALRKGDWSLTLTLWQEREVIRIEPGYVESLVGLAVDIGSTTVAGYLCDLRTGELLLTEALMNPQVGYGEDLMSRVSYGMMNPQGVRRLNRAIVKALNDLAKKASERAGLGSREITDLVLVGNTVMHHLALGIDPVELGGAPFALASDEALDLKARDLGLSAVAAAARVHVLPCIAGHVGADNVAVLLNEQGLLDEKITLLVDIGTNAEILLGNRERMLSASSPTGPAFEGAQISHGQRAAPGAIERLRIDMQEKEVRFKTVGEEAWGGGKHAMAGARPTGICGSGMIEVVGELFLAGLIDAGGLFLPEAHERHPNVRLAGRTHELVLASGEVTASGEEIVVTQNDIRQIQLAKAALYAGIRLLMDQMGVEKVERIKLAGAFGSYIDPRYAMVIGLIPDCDLEAVSAIGNAAGDGARMALVNRRMRTRAKEAARAVEYIETAVATRFQEYFVAALGLPHGSDAFPHLEGILPAQALPSSGRRSGRRRTRRTREAGQDRNH